MIDGTRIEGMWHLPGNEREAQGTLTIAPDGTAELHVPTGLRSFTDYGVAESKGATTKITFTEESLAQSAEHPRVLGVSGLKAYTLEGCIRTRSQTLFGGGTAETFLVNQVYAGVEFEQDEDPCGDGLRLRLAYLEDWVQESGIAYTVSTRSDGVEVTDSPAFTLHATQIAKRTTSLADGSSVSLVHRVGMRGDPLEEQALTQHFEFHVGTPTVVPMSELLDYGGRLQDIVSIGTRRVAEFRHVEAYHPDVVHTYRDGHSIREPFGVISRWNVDDPTPDRKRPIEHDMWFTLETLGGVDAVGRWLDAAATYRTPVRRVMATTYSPTMYQSDRLLNCAAALGGLRPHARRWGHDLQGPTTSMRLTRRISVSGRATRP